MDGIYRNQDKQNSSFQIASIAQLHALNGLKVLAILLVFNSHCGKLYPVSVMATGGALGNALFFILSGYFLKVDDKKISRWIIKKIMRLYPAMLIVSVGYALIFQYFPENIQAIVARFIWPTGYWFIGGLLLFNIIIYFFEKYNMFKNFTLYSIILWIIYFVCYILFVNKEIWSVEENGFFRLIYYFYIFSVGYCLKTERIHAKISTRLALVSAVICFLGQIGWKFIMIKIQPLMVTQFLCQILGVLFAVSMLIYTLNIEKKYCKLPKQLINIVDLCSRYSLEIYLTQRTAQRIALGANFPINIFIAVVITIIYSLALKRITKILVNRNIKFDYIYK